MKKFLMTLSVFLFAVLSIHAQQNILTDSLTVYKNIDGVVITQKEFNDIAQSGKYAITPEIINGKVTQLTFKVEDKTTSARQKKVRESIENYTKEWTAKKAPDFTGKDLNNNEVSNTKFKGKVIVLKFWFTACHPCLEEMPELNKMIDNKYKNNSDVVFLAPCMDENKQVINKTLAQHPFNYSTLYNAHDIADKYGVSAFPTHIVIDKNGIITYANVSAGNGTIQLQNAIDAALAKK